MCEIHLESLGHCFDMHMLSLEHLELRQPRFRNEKTVKEQFRVPEQGF